LKFSCSKCSADQVDNKARSEIIKTSNMLFGTLEPNFLWEFLSDVYERVLWPSEVSPHCVRRPYGSIYLFIYLSQKTTQSLNLQCSLNLQSSLNSILWHVLVQCAPLLAAHCTACHMGLIWFNLIWFVLFYMDRLNKTRSLFYIKVHEAEKPLIKGIGSVNRVHLTVLLSVEKIYVLCIT